MQVLGRYTRKEFNFDQYAAPHFSHSESKLYHSCGEDALATLTKKGYTREERKRFGRVLHRADMVKLLRKRGFTVTPLSVCMVTNTRRYYNRLREHHVVLNCQLFMRDEASWSICHGGLYCHSGRWDNSWGLEFINRPIIASYLIWHPTWAPTHGFSP